MAEEGLKRKLAAILNADVVGYSRLMGDDEESTIRALTIYRAGMTALIQQHRGRVASENQIGLSIGRIRTISQAF
jgi:class 3 adenylate cyclase